MSELQAVLFDMDGTICETETAWMAAEHAIAARYDAEWTPRDGLAIVGHSLLDAGAYMKKRMGLSQSPTAIVEEMLDEVVATIERDGVEWRPGALELVRACNDAGVPSALVTMSYRRFAGSIVDAMPFGRFDQVVTGDEVSRGKPAPEPYLTAAERLGVEPIGCIAVEDSPTGADSAEAAGCLVVTVPNHVQIPLTAQRRQRGSLAGLSVDDLRELISQR